MRNLLLFAFATSLIFVASCKKDDPSFSGAKVSTRTNLLGGYVETFSYNSKGDIGMITRTLGDKSIFTYSGDTVLMQSINNASVTYNGIRYLLHGDTYADTSYGLYQSQNNSTAYSYDSNGQLTQQRNYGFGALNSISDYTIGNKNISQIINTNVASNTHSYSYFTYSTSSNTIGNQNFGMGFLGVGTLYLPLTQVQINENGDTTGIITYKYHFNGNSNVDTLATYDRSGHVIDSIAYTY